MKKLHIPLRVVVLSLFFLSYLYGENLFEGVSCVAAEREKLLVVATLFPQYDFARRIAGDLATVEMLLPPGVEGHMFDPRPGDIRLLNGADLFIFTGEGMEPWAGRILDALDNEGLVVVDASSGIELHDTESHDHGDDPHVWLDPALAMEMVDNIADGLCRRDPINAEVYMKNARAYRAELEKLDGEFAVAAGRKSGSEIPVMRFRGPLNLDTLVFGGPFAYIYFLERYGLKYVTAWENCSAEGEPGIRRIADVIRYMRNNDVRFIFYDPLEDSKVARSIAEQAGAELLSFHTAHSVGRPEFEAGITYLDLMRNNLENVKKALNRRYGVEF
ncbi:MAG: zinc ABC transporter substrate-binding protein [Synergistaceae bacterium]|nr:zinc ABC transporter substrate-binding protein [Synergistaceae bacterium]